VARTAIADGLKRSGRRFRRRGRGFQVSAVVVVLAVVGGLVYAVAGATGSRGTTSLTEGLGATTDLVGVGRASTSTRGIVGNKINVFFPIVDLTTLAVEEGFAGDTEDYQQANARYKEDVAAEAAAEAQLNLAQLNLTYTKVVSPVNGFITNMHLAVGTYVTAGEALMALVDTDSFYVYGFFPETELGNIHAGDAAVVELMGYNGQKMDGTVQSIGWAIYRDDGSAQNLLPAISPTIDWVRLAQRFPVRVKLNYKFTGSEPPLLRSGQTVSVIILKKGDTGQFVPWWVW